MVEQNKYGIDLPPISDALLFALDGKFPNVCPSLNDADRMIWFKAGQRSVVDYMKDQYERQGQAVSNGESLLGASL